MNILSDKLQKIISMLSGKKRLTKSQIEEGLEQIRDALIEADVSLKVIQHFTEAVKRDATGHEVISGVTPADMFIKIVYDSLVASFGAPSAGLTIKEPTRLSEILLCGLQGSGKTTTCGKLARYYKQKRDILLVSLDIYRPAANEQLKILSEQSGVGFFDRGNEKKLTSIIKDAQKFAKKNAVNMIIYDTAGRTQIDKEMLAELKSVYNRIRPCETILVCDSMTGQSALSVTAEFKATVPVSGLIFTKYDSDARGGAVLSVSQVTDSKVKFVGIGEKLTDLDLFDPSRITDRILGKGDIVGLVNKAQENIDEEKAARLISKIENKEFDLQDFQDQLSQIRGMGPLENVIAMIPGMSKAARSVNTDESDFIRMESIINSMTKTERSRPFMLNNSRKMRVARGSGTTVLAVNQLLKKYGDMKNIMKKMKSPSKMSKMMEQVTGGQFDISGFEQKINAQNFNEKTVHSSPDGVKTPSLTPDGGSFPFSMESLKNINPFSKKV